ncbi:hypothetical protein MKW98_008831 [Papaver atlanticum]|uniref:Uncharacterized protein n=1 Tax=Papaver atlanticum TaxID=357466 RepID=A0AAD4S7A8_9MAGN|nr:hypothetical protein MKW98_008831 [Papaver atlanticum]
MGLTGATLKELVPVIKGIIKLQYDTKFKYRQYYEDFSIDAAYYAAQCGEQALLRQEAELPGEEQKVEMKMQHPQNLTPILKNEKTSLGWECWYVLQRGRKPNGPPSREIPDAEH